jgi:hypothetical protein
MFLLELKQVGDIVEEWKLVGAFVTSADFGEGDWSNDGEPMTVALELSIDYAVLQY